MNDELELIVQNMLNAGESEDNIALVIQNYVPEKVETITETTEAPPVEDSELVSENIYLDEPATKPQASIMVGGSRVYLNEVVQSLQDQDNRPLEVQTKEYKDKVIDIAKDTSLNKQQKDEQISSVLKPSYLILKSGTGDEAVYEPRPEVKKKMADNMPESIKEFKTKEDLTNAINESIGKTIRDDEGIKALVEVQQFSKKDILEEKALQIQSKADLTTPEGVAKAKKEFNDFYAAEVYGELEKSPAFNKIIKDLEVVGADVAGNLNKEWGRYNDDFLRKIDESESRGGIKESAKKSILNFKDAINKAIISGEQLSFEKESKELKELKYKLSNKSISLEDEVSVDVQEVGVYGGLVNKTKKVKVKDRIKELSKDKKQLTKDIVEGLEKVKKDKEYISLFTETPDIEGSGFEYFLNATKAAPSIIAEQAVNLGIGGLSIFGGPITAGIATVAMFTPMYAENYWGALTEGLRKDLGKEPESEDYLKALEDGDYASQLNSVAVAGLQTLFERFGAKKVLNSTFGSLGKNTASGIGSLYKGEIKKFVKNAAKKGVDMTESAFTERLTESAQSFLNQVSIGTQTGGATDMFKYIDVDQINKEGEMGMIAGFFMPFAGNVARQSFVELRNSARDVATKFDLTSNIELAQADKFFNAAQDNIDNKFKNGEITAEEKQVEVEALANTRSAGLKIPKKFGVQAKQKSFDLILERQNLQDQVNREDEAFTVPAKERIKEINTELGNIQAVETATRAAVKAVEKADIDIEVKELKDSEEVADFLIKQDPNITESKAKEAGRQRGFILSDGKTIVINKDVASKEGAVTTAAHEILHGVLFNTLNKGDESAFALANAIKMQLSNISTEDFKNSDLAARIEQYKADPDINEATKAEEVLTLFSEAIATGDIKFEEGVFTKLKDFIRRILQNAGFSNIDFNDSKDVYNFIKDYNKSISKGKFTKAQVKAAKEGVVVSKRLKDRVKDVAEKGVDETILKFSKTEDNKEIKEIFDEFTGPAENRKFKSKEEFKGVPILDEKGEIISYEKDPAPEFFDALLEIEQSNTLDASIRNTVSESYLDMNPGFVEEVKEKISDKFKSEYDASKNSLFGWLTGKNISGQPLINRASGDIQIKRGKKPSTVSADKKIGGEDTKTTVAETLVSDDISPEDYTDMKLVQDKLKKIKPQQSKIAKKIDLTDNEINLAKRDVINFLRKTDRPAMTDAKKFFKALVDYTTGKGVQPGGFANVIYDKLSLPKNGELSTKNRESFIKKIAEDLIALNKVDPAVMRRSNWTPFYELEIKNMNPTQMQKAIDEGRIPSTSNLKSGLDLFKTLDPSVDQVVDYLMGIRPDVLKRKMPKFLAEVIVKNEFNDIVENTKQPIYDAKGNETNNTVDLSESITEEEVKRGAPQVREKIARPKGIKFSLTTKKDLNWKTDEAGGMTASFNINKKKYNIELYPVDDEGDYRLNFNLETKDGATEEITGTGDSFKVISTVYNGIVDEIESNPDIKSFQFESDKSEPTRVRLYTTLMNKFADKLGWESDIYESTRYDGTGSFDFELVKPKLKNTVKKELDKINKSKSKDKKSGKEELDVIVDSQGLANIRGDVNALRSVMIMVANKAKRFGLDGINKILMPGNLTLGNRIDLLRKFGFNVISNPEKIKNTKLKKEAYEAVKKGEFLDLSSVLKEVTKGVEKIKNEDVNAIKIALGAKSGVGAKRNANRKKQHDKGVELITNLELDVFLESIEGEAFIRLISHNDKLNKNGSRNQALPNSVEVGATVNGERRSETTDEHQWQANEWVKGKLKLFKNIKNNLGTKQEKIARKALDLYLDFSKNNYTQFLLKNETDIIKGDLTNSKGEVWKKSGSTLHPILKEKLNNFIELAGKKGITEKQLQEAFDEIPSADIRYFSNYGYVNPNFIRTYKADGSYTTKAEEYNVVVPNKFKNDPNVVVEQGKIIESVILTEAGILTGAKAVSRSQAKQAINKSLKIAPQQQKAAKFSKSMLNDSKVLDVEGNLSMQDLLNKAAGIDQALNNARDPIAPVKKIRVFDFDDTLATTKSDVLFTAPDGTEGKLNAEEFAKQGAQLLEEGYVFDFSEFNKVTKGKPGPLLDIAKKIQAARGTEDVFVLTARAPEAQVAIKEFLDSVGLNIPLENITGLGNSTGEAKANWMIDKAAEGYNDFYFADDAYQNVKAVRDVMSVIDVKSKVQQAKFSLAKDLNSDFNKILENKTGIGAEKVYSDARAKTVGANKGKFKFFIPPSAEDFVGLLYPTLAKGKLGDKQMAWYKERLLNPFARAMENLSRDRVNLMADFKALKKELEVPKDLRREAIDGFTNEQAVRVYLWNKQGLDIPGISKRDLKDLTDVINNNPKLKVFADQLQAINKSEGYPSPQESWLVGTITTDLINGLNTVKRSKYLEEWQTNSDIIFSKENLNKMEAIYGANYREAMENILSRMKTGKNRLFSDSRIANQVLDYINGSIGAIMFFNTRSAVLQTISSMNFINWSDNNVYKAGKAFANQKQYWSDFTKLMNSDFLKDRRQGLKLNISESEIADAAATSKNKAKAALNYLLQKGFLPTQIADSFAIASGGATFYRNKINALVKQGIPQKEAEEQAYRDFREIAEESQQSSRPDKISQQQASNVGRVVLAFANTPSQYARIIKKAVSDLKNKRGNWKNNVSKIIYYGAMQNLIFNVLQQALFTIGFEYTDEEEEDKKYTKVANGMVDSLLRGLGYGGAAVAVGKNLLLNVYERSKRDRPEYVDAAWKMLDFSPPIASKVSKLKAAGYMVDKYEDEMSYKGFSIDNPAYEAASKVISATTNVPLDRLFSKVNNISAAMESDTEAWQSLAMMLGWSEWQIKPAKKQEEQNYILIK